MPKSRYYQHRAGRHSLARFVLLAVLLCGTGFAGYKKYSGSLTWGFNPQKLVADSVLSGKTFETEVREVVSPRAKIKAYLFEDRTNPIISVSFLFKNAGLANDAESEVGISGMAASLLTTGAGDMDRLQFSEELEDRAVSIGFSAGRDDFSGALLTTKAEASRAYELLSMVLTQPRFAPEDIAQAKAERLLLLKQQQERPERVLALSAGKALFWTHPYGRNPLGEAGDIAAVTREKLLEYVRNHLVRSNLIVGIARRYNAGGSPEPCWMKFSVPCLKADVRHLCVRQRLILLRGIKTLPEFCRKALPSLQRRALPATTATFIRCMWLIIFWAVPG